MSEDFEYEDMNSEYLADESAEMINLAQTSVNKVRAELVRMSLS